MLGKLLKYEFKSQVKMFCGLYGFGLLVAVVSFVFNILAEKFTNVPILAVAKTFTFGILIILVVVLFAATLIFALLRYRNNLLKDQGYLMHTLPVKTVDLVLAKLIPAVCWFSLDTIVAYVLLSFAARDFSALGQYLDAFSELGVNSKALVLLFSILFFLAGVVASLAQFYMSLSIGYTAYGSKDLMSFVAYIIVYVITQILSFILMIVTCLISYRSFSVTIDTMNNDTDPMGFIKVLLVASLIFGVIVSVIELVVAVKVMEKKLNLE